MRASASARSSNQTRVWPSQSTPQRLAARSRICRPNPPSGRPAASPGVNPSPASMTLTVTSVLARARGEPDPLLLRPARVKDGVADHLGDEQQERLATRAVQADVAAQSGHRGAREAGRLDGTGKRELDRGDPLGRRGAHA